MSAPPLMRAAGPKPTSIAQRANAIFSRSVPTGSCSALEHVARRAARVDERIAPRAVRDDGTGAEGAQPQGAQVEGATCLRIARVEQLEPAVEQQPVDPVGAHPSARLLVGLEQDDLESGTAQHPRGDQPGQAGTDDHDVARVGP